MTTTKVLEDVHDLYCPDVGLGCNANEPRALRKCPIFQAMVSVSKAPSLETMLEDFRRAGWTVAAHNDYHHKSQFHTFWLLTHPNGRWMKGEGPTDVEALRDLHAGIFKDGGVGRPPREGAGKPARRGKVR